MSNWRVPSIEGIQLTTAALAMAAAGVILMAASGASALACLLGAALMMINLYFLSFIGRTMLTIARRAGGATPLGLVAAPFKMVLLGGAVYLIIESRRVNVPGFIAGTLIQIVSIFIEVGRTLIRDKPSAP